MCAAGHERPLERRDPEAVEHSGGYSDDVLGGRADLVADQVVAVVETDQVAREGVDQAVLERVVRRVDDHAVGHAAHEFLRVARADPDRRAHVGQAVVDHLREAHARLDLEALHAEDEGAAGRAVAGVDPGDLRAERAQALRVYRDDHRVRVKRRVEVVDQFHRVRKRDHAVRAIAREARHVRRVRRAVKTDVVAHAVKVPRDAAAPSAAADHVYFHSLFLSGCA